MESWSPENQTASAFVVQDANLFVVGSKLGRLVFCTARLFVLPPMSWTHGPHWQTCAYGQGRRCHGGEALEVFCPSAGLHNLNMVSLQCNLPLATPYQKRERTRFRLHVSCMSGNVYAGAKGGRIAVSICGSALPRKVPE